MAGRFTPLMLQALPTPDGGTDMTLRNRGNPSGFAKITAPLMALAKRRANPRIWPA